MKFLVYLMILIICICIAPPGYESDFNWLLHFNEGPDLSWLPTAYRGTWTNLTILFGGDSQANGAAQEPTVIYEGNPQILTNYINVFKMWWRGNWNSPYTINYAESANGINWTQYSGNPLITGDYAQPDVFHFGNTYYLYLETDSGLELCRFHSSNGINWVYDGIVLTTGTWDNSLANAWIQYNSAKDWSMIYDGMDRETSTYVWMEGYATSTDGGMTWTKHSGNPVIGFSGVWFGKYDGTYYFWGQYTAGYPVYSDWGFNSNVTTCCILPTDIGCATSKNLIYWNLNPKNPVVTRNMVGHQYDNNDGQVADPCLLETQGKIWMYFDAEPNQTTGYIGCVSMLE